MHESQIVCQWADCYNFQEGDRMITTVGLLRIESVNPRGEPERVVCLEGGKKTVFGPNGRIHVVRKDPLTGTSSQDSQPRARNKGDKRSHMTQPQIVTCKAGSYIAQENDRFAIGTDVPDSMPAVLSVGKLAGRITFELEHHDGRPQFVRMRCEDTISIVRYPPMKAIRTMTDDDINQECAHHAEAIRSIKADLGVSQIRLEALEKEKERRSVPAELSANGLTATGGVLKLDYAKDGKALYANQEESFFIPVGVLRGSRSNLYRWFRDEYQKRAEQAAQRHKESMERLADLEACSVSNLNDRAMIQDRANTIRQRVEKCRTWAEKVSRHHTRLCIQVDQMSGLGGFFSTHFALSGLGDLIAPAPAF